MRLISASGRPMSLRLMYWMGRPAVLTSVWAQPVARGLQTTYHKQQASTEEECMGCPKRRRKGCPCKRLMCAVAAEIQRAPQEEFVDVESDDRCTEADSGSGPEPELSGASGGVISEHLRILYRGHRQESGGDNS